MKSMRYFPLHVIILFWLQSRRAVDESLHVTAYSLAERRGYIERMIQELEGTQSGYIQRWLMHVLQEELQTILLLQDAGLIDSGFVLKK